MNQTTYKYPFVAVEGDKFILTGAKHPDAVLTMDWAGETPKILKVVFDYEEIEENRVDVFFELKQDGDKTANLVISD